MKRIKYLAIVPARGNSKRIKNKNLIKFKKKTLIDITLEQIEKINKINLAILTSDSDKILNIGNKYKKCLKLKRPLRISKYNSKTEDAIMHAIRNIEKNYKIKNIILLQVTSPLRNTKDINQCIRVYEKKKLSCIFSCYEKKSFIWKKKGKTFDSINYNYKKRVMSQNMEKIYFENGAIYIFNFEKFKKYKNRIIKPFDIYLMSEKKSIDLDDHEDLKTLKKYEKKAQC